MGLHKEKSILLVTESDQAPYVVPNKNVALLCVYIVKFFTPFEYKILSKMHQIIFTVVSIA